MSSSSDPVTAELLCSVCLDVFNDPVTTPCGHNFCKICLNTHWSNSPDGRCPNCNKTFNQRPKLKINTTLRNLVDQNKKKTAEKQPECLCDVCKEVKLKALKSCLLLAEIDEKQKSAEKQYEVLIKDLEQKITVLKRRNTELKKITKTKEKHLRLIQILLVVIIMSVGIFLWNHFFISFTDVQTLNIEKLNETVLERRHLYAVDVTLDPDTANPYLILSDNKKQVRYGGFSLWRPFLPDNSKRFDYSVSVLGKQGFSSGRFYFEVQVKENTAWTLGMARESVNRKDKITLTPANGFWTVSLWNVNEYICADPDVYLCLCVSPQKVGVFVDYEEGLVSFYDVASRSHIYSFTNQSFTEKLYPYFNPGSNNWGWNAEPLIITPVNNN
nr:E3 ubiquitin-protein ligase TRIM21-like isoform X1 [Misgurnus anguillicaudatus]